ncbi:uncharacterized protein LOC119730657 [Patiria miniata]|uniref:Uncharacterized protein n=1 Tax=Patiria miniata TaxID=46514 RepID=A0A914A731_PATMI|nr:uncharacterized protein LOC119730657 [Patiria miniata]
MQRNQIRVITREMFKDLHSLEVLSVFGNPLIEIQAWLFFNTQLTNLYMFQNNFSSIGERPFATVNNTIKQVSLYGSHLTTISDVVWQDLGTNSYVAVDSTLQFAPVTCRTDLEM